MIYSYKEKRFLPTINVIFFRNLSIISWTLIFIIPGIIKAYKYCMVPYIIAENPHLPRRRVLEISKQMMKGHKFNTFVLSLSFTGWYILSAFTFNIIDYFYLRPYVLATEAELYLELKRISLNKGIIEYSEFYEQQKFMPF